MNDTQNGYISWRAAPTLWPWGLIGYVPTSSHRCDKLSPRATKDDSRRFLINQKAMWCLVNNQIEVELKLSLMTL